MASQLKRVCAILAGFAAIAAGALKEEDETCETGLKGNCALQSKLANNKADVNATAADQAVTWYVLGFTDYTVDSSGDVWVEAEVHPGGARFVGKSVLNSRSGNANLHFYVPSSAHYVDVKLQRKEAWWHNCWFGSCIKAQSRIYLGANPSWCDLATAASTGCTFTRKEESHTVTWEKSCGSWWCPWYPKWTTSVVGQISGYLATGAYLHQKVDALHMLGTAVKFDDFEASRNKYAQVRIRADNIAQEMAYAKTGSVFPASMHGIWWMDQRGVSVPPKNAPLASDPSYEQRCSAAVDEILVSFGVADWDSDTRCATGVTLKTSSPFKGQWALIDATGQGSEMYEVIKGTTPSLDFCMKGAGDDHIEIKIKASVNSFLTSLLDFTPFEWGAFIEVPSFLASFTMVKTAWGWDRQSRAAPQDVAKFVLKAFGGVMGTAGFDLDAIQDFSKPCSYPVFQVIDGDGNPTEHYQAYLDWANTQSDCSPSSFTCAPNKGRGTIMTPRQVPQRLA